MIIKALSGHKSDAVVQGYVAECVAMKEITCAAVTIGSKRKLEQDEHIMKPPHAPSVLRQVCPVSANPSFLHEVSASSCAPNILREVPAPTICVASNNPTAGEMFTSVTDKAGNKIVTFNITLNL